MPLKNLVSAPRLINTELFIPMETGIPVDPGDTSIAPSTDVRKDSTCACKKTMGKKRKTAKINRIADILHQLLFSPKFKGATFLQDQTAYRPALAQNEGAGRWIDL
jgi:hypothetical protein